MQFSYAGGQNHRDLSPVKLRLSHIASLISPRPYPSGHPFAVRSTSGGGPAPHRCNLGTIHHVTSPSGVWGGASCPVSTKFCFRTNH